MNPLLHLATPRLTAEQIGAFRTVKQLVGIKEYYGLNPVMYDPNQVIVKLKLKNPEMTNEVALDEMVKKVQSCCPRNIVGLGGKLFRDLHLSLGCCMAIEMVGE